MSLFILREGYRVVTTPSGARVVHVRTGGSIELSPEDVLLFARATAGGVDSSDPQLRNVIRRFVMLGVLVSAGDSPAGDKRPPESGGSPAPADPGQSAPRPPAVAPQVSAAPRASVPRPPSVAPTSPVAPPPGGPSPASNGQAPSAPTSAPAPSIESALSSAAAAGTRPRASDVVRLFRADLKVNPRQGSNLLDVTDPLTGKTFPHYDFEISLARMLDGRRLYSEVVEAGQRLGIPVNLESLYQFIGQLERYGFLAPPDTALPERREEVTRAPRQKWDESLRALFQTGLRMHRQGRYDEAANYFQAMLEQDPQNREALEMIEQTRRRLGATAGNEVIPSASDSAQVTLEELFFKADESPPEADESPPAPPVKGPPALPPIQSRSSVWSAERTRPAPRRRVPWVPLGVGAFALAGASAASWLIFSQQYEASAAAGKLAFKKSLKAGSEQPQLAVDGGAGQVAAAAFDAGDSHDLPRKVQLDEAALPRNAPAELRPDAGTANEGSRSTASFSAEDAGGLSAAASNASAQGLERSDAGVPAHEPRRQWIAAKIAKRGRVTMGEIAAPADGIISWKASANQRVKRGDPIGSLFEKGSFRERPLVAPKDGLFIPKVSDGTGVESTEGVAVIVYHEAYLQALVADARPEPTWSCEVYHSASSAKASCKIVEVVKRGSKSFMTATTEPTWFDTAADARVRVSPPD